jgi:hypothetical protein
MSSNIWYVRYRKTTSQKWTKCKLYNEASLHRLIENLIDNNNPIIIKVKKVENESKEKV